MGSSQSQLSRSASSSQRRPQSSNPLRSIRRLSTLGRRNRENAPSTQHFHDRSEDSRIEPDEMGLSLEQTSSGGAKRTRQPSCPGEIRLGSMDRKKPRTEPLVRRDSSVHARDQIMTSVTLEHGELSSQTNAESYPQPTSPTPVPIPIPRSAPVSPTSMNSEDPLAQERLQSLATIRDVLGSDWPSQNSANESAVEDLWRQSSHNTEAGPSSELHSTALNSDLDTSADPHIVEARASLQRATNQARNLADRIAALSARLDRSSASTCSAAATNATVQGSIAPLHSSESNVVSSTEIQPEVLLRSGNMDSTMEDLAQRLNDARQELTETERQLNDTRDRFEAARRRRVPTGAVLIIQGLAQTQTMPDIENESTTSRGHSDNENTSIGLESEMRRARRRLRRASESRTYDRGINSGRETEHRGVPLERQADTISNLLTVAAAATATTLLSPGGNRPPLAPMQQPRTPSSTLENLLGRLMPHRPPRQQSQSVEATLGSYLRNVLRENRTSEASDDFAQSSNPAVSSPSGLQPLRESQARLQRSDATAEAQEEVISTEFQHFLEELQGDLVGAVRSFAGPSHPNIDEDRESFATAQEGQSDTSTPGPSNMKSCAGNSAASSPMLDESQSLPTTIDIPATENSGSVPSFHAQLAQNLPNARHTATSVSGGHDGIPRRLNFFRVHMFPAISPVTGSIINNSSERREDTEENAININASTVTGGFGEYEAFQNNSQPANQGNEEPLIPCIFIGVRSIRHDPSMTTHDLVSHPQFPFVNGEVPAESDTVASGESILGDETDENGRMRQASSSPVLQRPNSHPIERRSLRDRILSHLRRSPTPPPAGSLNTYLVYVIGGNYPRSHPILRMPSLIHGGPMTDEELQMVSDLLGPERAVTVDKEKLEKSGLRIIKGADVVEEGKSGMVMHACVERCMVCLSDYKPDEDCRILNCRHAFHKDCVDHWLTTGRNSCPACRSEAVETKPSWTENYSEDDNAASEQGIADLNAAEHMPAF
nr:hypothetical protein L204_04691 [Cryptococcus depauperatus CBS 7855]